MLVRKITAENVNPRHHKQKQSDLPQGVSERDDWEGFDILTFHLLAVSQLIQAGSGISMRNCLGEGYMA